MMYDSTAGRVRNEAVVLICTSRMTSADSIAFTCLKSSYYHTTSITEKHMSSYTMRGRLRQKGWIARQWRCRRIDAMRVASIIDLGAILTGRVSRKKGSCPGRDKRVASSRGCHQGFVWQNSERQLCNLRFQCISRFPRTARYLSSARDSRCACSKFHWYLSLWRTTNGENWSRWWLRTYCGPVTTAYGFSWTNWFIWHIELSPMTRREGQYSGFVMELVAHQQYCFNASPTWH